MSDGKAGSFIGAFFGAALGVVAGAFALGVIDLKRTKCPPSDTLRGSGLGGEDESLRTGERHEP